VTGVIGNAVEHVVSRSVRDSAAVLDAVCGAMPGDLYVAPPPARPYAQEVGREPDHLRVGILADDVFLNNPVHPECVEAVRRTARLLEDMGHAVVDSYPSALVGQSGLGLPLRILSASSLAARLDTWGERIGRPLTEEDVSAQVWERADLGRSYSAVQVNWALARLAAGAMRAPEWWHEGFDLLLTPTVQQPPPRWDEVRTEDEAATWGLFTMPWSVSGQPAISLPLHWTGDGLPVGIQLVADYGREDVLIRVASQLEEAAPWRQRFPPVFA
jgi:amidase